MLGELCWGEVQPAWGKVNQEVLAPLSWQLGGESGENPAAEDGLLLRSHISGGPGRMGAHGAG